MLAGYGGPPLLTGGGHRPVRPSAEVSIWRLLGRFATRIPIQRAASSSSNGAMVRCASMHESAAMAQCSATAPSGVGHPDKAVEQTGVRFVIGSYSDGVRETLGAALFALPAPAPAVPKCR